MNVNSMQSRETSSCRTPLRITRQYHYSSSDVSKQSEQSKTKLAELEHSCEQTPNVVMDNSPSRTIIRYTSNPNISSKSSPRRDLSSGAAVGSPQRNLVHSTPVLIPKPRLTFNRNMAQSEESVPKST